METIKCQIFYILNSNPCLDGITPSLHPQFYFCFLLRTECHAFLQTASDAISITFFFRNLTVFVVIQQRIKKHVHMLLPQRRDAMYSCRLWIHKTDNGSGIVIVKYQHCCPSKTQPQTSDQFRSFQRAVCCSMSGKMYCSCRRFNILLFGCLYF